MSSEPRLYEIGVRGRLGPSLQSALAGFEVVVCDGKETRLRGWVVDRSAMHAILDQVAALGLELTSVRSLDSDSG